MTGELDDVAALLADGRQQEALDAVEAVLAATPDSPTAHHQRALALHGLGRHEEALRAASWCAALDPNHWEPYVLLALTAASTGRLEVAWQAARAAVELAPEEPAAQEAVAEVARRREAWGPRTRLGRAVRARREGL